RKLTSSIYGKEPRHRRISGEGENYREVSGEELCREGLSGACEGPAQEEPFRGCGSRLHTRIRSHRRQKEADRRVEAGGEELGEHLSGGGPGSRRRSHLLPPSGGAEGRQAQ